MSDIVQQALDQFDKTKTAWHDNYSRAKDDLHFQSDDPYAQWDRLDYESRTSSGRPAETVDQLSQFVHQVANDIRMNTPTINIIPAGKEADVETAEIYKGLIRNIEYVSNADDVYDTAALNSVKSSIGFIRVDHDYENDDGFEQQLLIKRVTNPLACYIDPESVECDGRDAKYGFVIDKFPLKEFKAKYPKFDPVCFEVKKEISNKDDSVSIAEYFVLEEQEKEFALLEDGSTKEYVAGMNFRTKRTAKKTKVKRYKLSGKDILEETYFPGKYIPLVPVYGEEHWVEGKRNLFSLIRKSKGAQRLFNLWKSLETELLMKAPQAPVMAVEGQVEDYSADWQNPNKSMVLRYKQTDAQGNPAPPPQRLAPPPIPTGVVNAARETVEDIKATMGLYNAALGVRGSATSGKQELAQQQEGDVATYHFGDNLVRSITQVGRILVCAIPEIYDTQRIIRIIGEEDEPKSVGINGQIEEGQERAFDLTKGKYDVRVVTGATFTTKRQEAAQFFSDIVSRQPELMSVMGDLLFKNMDFTGASAMAERMKKVIDPKFLDENKEDDPEKQQLQAQLQEAQALMQQMQQQMQLVEQDKSTEQAKVQIDGQKAQTDAEFKAYELELKTKELALKEEEMRAKYALEQEKLKADVTKAKIDAKKTVSPDVAMTDPELHEDGIAPMAVMMEQFANVILQSNEANAQSIQILAQMQAEGTQAVIQAVTAPRTTQIVRDANGNISAGVSTVQ